MLYRMRQLYSVGQMMTMYKAQMLSTAEWCTAAIFHYTQTALRPIDIQGQFLKFIEIEQVTAFLEYNLAPLSLRRSIANLLLFLLRESVSAAPASWCALGLPTPLLLRGFTKVQSTATCPPCGKGKSSTTHSTRLSSVGATPLKFVSRK